MTSPAWVDGDLPARWSWRTRLMVSFSGMQSSSHEGIAKSRPIRNGGPMSHAAISTALEAALLRQLQAAWRGLNDSYFKGRLRPPTLALADGATKLGQWIARD